jgi:cell division protein FtsB
MGAPSWVYMRRIEHEQAAHSDDVSKLNAKIAELQQENEVLKKKVKELEDDNSRLKKRQALPVKP